MCGALRRRLPLIEDNGEPPVYWPSCLMDKFNEAEATENPGQTLDDCMMNCADDCRFWTYNKTSNICYYSKIFKVEKDLSGVDVVSGNKQCKSSTIYFPHCAKINMNYTGVDSVNMTGADSITTIESCIQACKDSPDCKSYLIETTKSIKELVSCDFR